MSFQRSTYKKDNQKKNNEIIELEEEMKSTMGMTSSTKKSFISLLGKAITKNKHHPIKTKILTFDLKFKNHTALYINKLFEWALRRANNQFVKNFLFSQNPLENAVSIDVVKNLHPNIIFFAICHENLTALEYLLHYNVNLNVQCSVNFTYSNVHSKEFSELTPLHAAIKVGSARMVRMICEKMSEQNLSFNKSISFKLISLIEEMKDKSATVRKVSLTPIEFAKKLGRVELVDIILKEQKQAVVRRANNAIKKCQLLIGENDVDIDARILNEFCDHLSQANHTMEYLNNATDYLLSCIAFVEKRNNQENRMIDIDQLILYIKSHQSSRFSFIETPTSILANQLTKELSALVLNGFTSISEKIFDMMLNRYLTDYLNPNIFDLIWDIKLLFIYPKSINKDSPLNGSMLRKNRHLLGSNIEAILINGPTKLDITDSFLQPSASIYDMGSTQEMIDPSQLSHYDLLEYKEEKEDKLEINPDYMESKEQKIDVSSIFYSFINDDVVIETKSTESKGKSLIADIKLTEKMTKKLAHSKDDLMLEPSLSKRKKSDFYGNSILNENNNNGIDIKKIKSYCNLFPQGNFPVFRWYVLYWLANKNDQLLMTYNVSQNKHEYYPLALTEIGILIEEALRYKNAKPLLFLVTFLPKDILFNDKYNMLWKEFLNSGVYSFRKFEILLNVGLVAKLSGSEKIYSLDDNIPIARRYFSENRNRYRIKHPVKLENRFESKLDPFDRIWQFKYNISEVLQVMAEDK